VDGAEKNSTGLHGQTTKVCLTSALGNKGFEPQNIFCVKKKYKIKLNLQAAGSAKSDKVI
jgi:hypothetical protein